MPEQDIFNEPFIYSESAVEADMFNEPFLSDFAPAANATLFIPWIGEDI